MRGRLFYTDNHCFIRFIFAAFMALVTLCLCACVRVVNGPADELRMYSWSAEYDNGNTASLSFDDQNAEFLIQNRDYTLSLHGLCVVTDDRLTVCDEESGMNYIFGYTLFGNRVELSCNGGLLTLKKVK